MLPILVSLLPVFAFLGMLVLLDNYKLVKPAVLLRAGCMGCAAAAAAYGLNQVALLAVTPTTLRVAVAPVIEETLKAIWPLVLVRRGRIGFIVDGAIIGFAVGSGFGFVENCYYLINLPEQNLMLWIFRGFGTALMHGGSTAICIMIAVVAQHRLGKKKWRLLVGLPLAMAIHSFFNLGIFPPLINTMGQVLGLPLLLMSLFAFSEKRTASWLQQGFDTDMAMLEEIRSGTFGKTPQGLYLAGFRTSFSGEIVMDLFCYLRIHLELAIRAKGLLLMRESGFESAIDDTVKGRFTELEYLRKSIGRGGMTILRPLLHQSPKELWQIYFLQEQERKR